MGLALGSDTQGRRVEVHESVTKLRRLCAACPTLRSCCAQPHHPGKRPTKKQPLSLLTVKRRLPRAAPSPPLARASRSDPTSAARRRSSIAARPAHQTGFSTPIGPRHRPPQPSSTPTLGCRHLATDCRSRNRCSRPDPALGLPPHGTEPPPQAATNACPAPGRAPALQSSRRSHRTPSWRSTARARSMTELGEVSSNSGRSSPIHPCESLATRGLPLCHGGRQWRGPAARAHCSPPRRAQRSPSNTALPINGSHWVDDRARRGFPPTQAGLPPYTRARQDQRARSPEPSGPLLDTRARHSLPEACLPSVRVTW